MKNSWPVAFRCEIAFDHRSTGTGTLKGKPLMAEKEKIRELLSEVETLRYRLAEVEAANAEITRRNNLLLFLMETMPSPCMVIDAESHRVVMSNPAAGKDQLEDEITCHKLSHNRETPCEGEEHACPLIDVKKTGKPVKVEHIHRYQGGAHRTYEIHAFPMPDKSGKVKYVIEYCFDITEHRDIQRQAEVAVERFEKVSENAGVWLWEVDQNGLYTHASLSVASVLGYEPEEIVGKKHFYDLFHPEDREELRRDAFEVFSRREPFREFTNRNVSKQGETVWLSTRGIPLLDGHGALRGYSGQDIDVTMLKNAEADRVLLEKKLHETQKLESLGVLAGGIAHDFNNLLVGVLGNADLALLDLSPESPALPHVRDITKAARHLAELTRQMLAYSGKGKFVSGPLDLSKLVKDIAHLLGVSISKQAAIKLGLQPNLPSIHADASQIRQVIMNLITNASEAIGEKSGVITLSTGVIVADRKYLAEVFSGQDLPDGHYVFLEVSDNGEGMEQKTVTQIFDPFFTTKFTGCGLGLAAVLGIMKGHGGAIKVYSEQGRGSTFKLLFPSMGRIEAVPSEKRPDIDREHMGGGTILVVDDEETVLTVAKVMLERSGFDVLTAGDGLQALDVLRAHVKDVVAVLLDLTMPHMDGLETFKQIRQIRQDLPVILTSGYNEQNATSQFTGKGLAGFVQKPYELGPLTEELWRVLKRCQK